MFGLYPLVITYTTTTSLAVNNPNQILHPQASLFVLYFWRMKKAYQLAQCSTCQRILEEINWQGDSQNIREEKITEHQIDEMASLSGSYESLFSRRAIKYKSMGLKEKSLSESDYKRLILEEDTFLKRPVFIVNDSIFIGNSKKTVEALKKCLDE